MHTLTLSKLTLLALGLSLLATVSFRLFTTICHASEALALSLLFIGFIYVSFLLIYSPVKTGRFLIMLVFLIASVSLTYLSSALELLLAFYLLSFWLIRTYCYQRSWRAASWDASLIFFAYLAAMWALNSTGSIFLSFWCFFATQALFIYIPQKNMTKPENNASNQAFVTAYQNAQAAIKQLSQSI